MFIQNPQAKIWIVIKVGAKIIIIIIISWDHLYGLTPAPKEPWASNLKTAFKLIVSS